MIFYFGIAVAGILFYVFDCKSLVNHKYEKFTQLNKLVATQHSSRFMVLYVSILMVIKMWWMNFLQYSNNTIEIYDKKSVNISYILDGRLYKLYVKRRRGPVLVLLVTDENNEDVSDLVIPYMGPERNWHNTVFTPNFWNKENLTFELSSSETKKFNRHESIII
jgi:Family of unknown function (DUF5772)